MPEPNCICFNCGKKHYRRPAAIKKTQYVCCSKECRSVLLSKRYSGKNNPAYGKSYNKGIPRTDEVRKKISESNKLNVEYNIAKGIRLGKSNKGKQNLKIRGKNNPMYNRPDIARKGFFALRKKRIENKDGYYYNGWYMRSTWEVKFAKWLDERNLKWDYEPRHLVCGHLGWYFPDFYIHNWQQYVEIKGFESEVGMNKFNYWKNREPTKFVLFNKPVLQELGII